MKEEAFQIRRAFKEDAGEVGRVHVEATRAAYRGIYSDDYLNSLSAEGRAARWVEEGKGHLAIGDPDFAVFVALCNDKIIGFSDVGPAREFELPKVAELYAIYLDPHYIGKGAGRALFTACVKHVDERGFKAMKTEVLSKNSLARAFYERMHGQPLLETEKLIETGGSRERVITYRWAALPQPSATGKNPVST